MPLIWKVGNLSNIFVQQLRNKISTIFLKSKYPKVVSGMITEERRQFLQKNKMRGDISKVVQILKSRNKKCALSLSMARNILYGTHWGKYGKQFTDELEILILERRQELAREKKKYSKLI